LKVASSKARISVSKSLFSTPQASRAASTTFSTTTTSPLPSNGKVIGDEIRNKPELEKVMWLDRDQKMDMYLMRGERV